MPAMGQRNTAVFYGECDTAPKLRRCLLDGGGNPIDLSGCTVTISVAQALELENYYIQPTGRIVNDSPCVIADQTVPENLGWISWTPGACDSDSALTPPGQYLYQFAITYQDGGLQRIPADTYLPMVIRTRAGGRADQRVGP